jgi:hypothetical protein
MPTPQDPFYDAVAAELRERVLQPGLWTRAYAEADGNEPRARAIYIKLRVAQLAADAAAAAAADAKREAAEQKAEEERAWRERQEIRQREEELMAHSKPVEIPTPFKILIIAFIIFVVLILFFLSDKK